MHRNVLTSVHESAASIVFFVGPVFLNSYLGLSPELKPSLLHTCLCRSLTLDTHDPILQHLPIQHLHRQDREPTNKKSVMKRLDGIMYVQEHTQD